MKFWNWILKLLATAAAIAGIAYVVVNYGDKIVAWVKRKLNQYGLCCCDYCEDEEFLAEEIADAPVEEAPQEETPAETVAEEADFEV